MKLIPTHPYQKQLFRKNLHAIFGNFDDKFLNNLEQHLEWYEINGGEILFKQGDDGDALYFMVSGRLQAFVNYSLPNQLKVGEIIRGETVGEMAVFTGEKRTATIIAVRDSVLVKLSSTQFKAVITNYPAVFINVTNLIIHRLQKSQAKKEYKKPVNISIVPLHTTINVSEFATKFYNALQQKGATYIATPQKALEQKNTNQENLSTQQALTYWIDETEAHHEFLLFEAEHEITEWTKRCIRQADVVMLLADATAVPNLTAIDDLKKSNNLQTLAQHHLVLIHPTETLLPSGTANWLRQRPWVSQHYHIKQNDDSFIQRLARLYSGSAIGLVLAGGGCKGFAHIGVLQALEEANIPIDVVGGTSVGAQVAGAIAFNQGSKNVSKYLREGAFYNPTRDINIYPIVSIIKGNRIENMIKNSILRFANTDAVDLEDLWIPFYAICTNYTHAKEELHTRGNLIKCLKATTAIPGVYPPVIDNNSLLIDGGTFNNFPADVMTHFGVSKIIGVDFSQEKNIDLKQANMPNAWELFKDKFRSKKNKKFRLPGLFSILLNAPLLYSYAKHAETKAMVDLYFNPNVAKFGLVNWKAFDAIKAEGYKHAKEVLANLSPNEIQKFKQ